jgi:hypothetical protein
MEIKKLPLRCHQDKSIDKIVILLVDDAFLRTRKKPSLKLLIGQHKIPQQEIIQTSGV